ncbi:MAG: hypothetical protein HC861_02730 [Rhodospirillaceae bacterium]|nr:hypothetical protein [Rhodospirillaceae bacterium]
MTKAFALSASVLAIAAGAAQAAQLVPHRAVYELSAKSAGASDAAAPCAACSPTS